MSAKETTRLTAAERREQILDAAFVVFGERGYVGGTTDAIAKQAGVSQAYVVRMFGGKEALFREAAQAAAQRVIDVFRAAISQLDDTTDSAHKHIALATAYGNLIADRGLLLTLLQLFSLGHHATFGPLARDCYLRVYQVVRDEARMGPEEASQFFARGMLTTVLLAMRMPDAADNPAAMELMSCTFGDTTTDIITLTNMQLPLDSDDGR